MKYPFIGRCRENGLTVLFYKNKVGVTIDVGNSAVAEHGKFELGFAEREFVDITAEYLRNTKIKVLSPEHSEMIQRLVFNAGGRWASGSNEELIHTNAEYLTIDKDLTLYLCSPGHFSELDRKEITLPLPPKEGKEMEGGCRGIGVIEEILGCKLESKSGAAQEKPIYTREMHERGELPPVGSEALTSFDRHNQRVTIAFYSVNNQGWDIALVFDDKHPFWVVAEDLKPLPTPEDELAYQLSVEGESESVNLSHKLIARAIINGEIDGVKWEGEQ